MRKTLITTFLAGILLGGISFYTYKVSSINVTEVLSEKVEVTPTAIQTPTPTPQPTDTPTPTLVPTKKPIPTPTPVPTPTPIVKAPENFEPLFSEFASVYGVDANLLKKIAECETHFNNSVSAPPYAGMFQFLENTWVTYRKLMGKDPDINLRYGARESIETAAYVVSLGKLHLWPVCAK